MRETQHLSESPFLCFEIGTHEGVEPLVLKLYPSPCTSRGLGLQMCAAPCGASSLLKEIFKIGMKARWWWWRMPWEAAAVLFTE